MSTSTFRLRISLYRIIEKYPQTFKRLTLKRIVYNKTNNNIYYTILYILSTSLYHMNV